MSAEVKEGIYLNVPKESIVDLIIEGLEGQWSFPFPTAISDLAFTNNGEIPPEAFISFDLSSILGESSPLLAGWYGPDIAYYDIWLLGTR